MSERVNEPKALDASNRDGRGVVDPEWELELLAGREADPEAAQAGSIEPELSTLHLLRHLREPESLSAAQLDATWTEIEQAIAPAREPFWARSWFKWMLPVAGAAAVAVLVLRPPAAGDEAGTSQIARADTPVRDNQASGELAAEASVTAPAPLAAARERAADDEAEVMSEAAAAGDGAASTSALLEQQFAALEAQARAQVGASVDDQRGSMRAALIAQAREGGA